MSDYEPLRPIDRDLIDWLGMHAQEACRISGDMAKAISAGARSPLVARRWAEKAADELLKLSTDIRLSVDRSER